MVDRITIKVPTYMKLDNQWSIVLPGTVCDVPSAGAFSPQNITVGTGAGALASHGGATPVSNVRRA